MQALGVVVFAVLVASGLAIRVTRARLALGVDYVGPRGARPGRQSMLAWARASARASAQFRPTPPDGVSPAETAYLLAGGPARRQTLATVLDLARRGHLRITVTTRRLGREWLVERRTGKDALSPSERRLCAEVTGCPRLSRLLRRFPVHPDVADATRRGWCERMPHPWIWPVLIIGMGVVLGYAAGTVAGFGAVLPAFVGIVIGANASYCPIAWTRAGTDLRIQAQGFRNYVCVDGGVKVTPAQVSALLPYAAAVGAGHELLAAARAHGMLELPGFDIGIDGDQVSALQALFDTISDFESDGSDGGDGDGGGD